VGSSVANLVRTDADDFALLLAKIKVEQLRPKGSKIVVVHRTDPVPELFKKLVDNNILSVPVINNDGKYYGFVDTRDIVVHVSNLFSDLNGTVLTDVEKLFDAEGKFVKTKVHDIAVYPIKKDSPNHPLHTGVSLWTAWEFLARTPENIHRLPVITDDGTIVDVITQSMLIDFLWQNIERIGKVGEMKVSEIQGNSKVLSVQQDTRAIVAFREMAASGVSGMAVLDNNGRITDNISLRDLKGIHHDAKIFWRLWNTVKVFKEKAIADFPPPTKISGPVVVTETDSLYGVVERMALNHIHRVYVVNDRTQMIPQRVISQTDVLREILGRVRAH
jgi:CBS domain-containing protein